MKTIGQDWSLPDSTAPGRATSSELLVSRSPMALKFEWHESKAESNWKRHGVRFELAQTVFSDPFAIERVDDREDDREETRVIVGMAQERIHLFVAFTERGTEFESFRHGERRSVSKTTSSHKLRRIPKCFALYRQPRL